MELRLGSVWLLLSCSMQQSLWGILASVPRTQGSKCSQSLSGGDSRSEVKRVQMIRRIPARCSGWDEAWSWISKLDCKTKYVLDYFEIPSEVQKSVDGNSECIEEEAQTSETSGDFDPTDEKFLAIAFGSATVALLILIVVIVVSLLRNGRSRCGGVCGGGPRYRTSTSGERLGEQSACNDYITDSVKAIEPEYEEIPDRRGPNKTELPPGLTNDPHWRYENGNAPSNGCEKEQAAIGVTNGNVVVPSAPREEDIHQHTEITFYSPETADDNKVPIQEDTISGVNGINSSNRDTKLSTIHGSTEDKINTGSKSEYDDDKEKKDSDKEITKLQNEYMIFEDLVKESNEPTVAHDIPLHRLEPSMDSNSVEMQSLTQGLEPAPEIKESSLDTAETAAGEVVPIHNAFKSTPDETMCSPTKLEITLEETDSLVMKPNSFEELSPSTEVGTTVGGHESLISYENQ